MTRPHDPSKLIELPPISTISLAEDFTPFMQAKVPQALRQQALKALFKEPHFNLMDGLDIYIDDYTVFEPISPEVMATLSSWKTIMNPPQQVVTEGGYAVDVESREGKAVLAAREAQAKMGAPNAPNATNASDSPLLPVDVGAADETLDPEIVEPLNQTQLAAVCAASHPRYGTRVGDFVAIEHVPNDAVVARTAPEISRP